MSDLLGIPRPTLYRYLREYSIPHLRQAGRISIPEDSFEKIRHARDLHKHGLGTECVRRAVREGTTAGAANSAETEDLKNRVDGLHDVLEGLRESLREKLATAEPAPHSPALQPILARQSLLMSALFHLTEMVEDLLLANGKPRKPAFPDLEVDLRDETPLPPAPERPHLEAPETEVPAHGTSRSVSHGATRGVSSRLAVSGFAASPGPERGEGFGSLGRRRRRGGAILLAALLVVLLLALAVPALIGGGGGSDSSGGGAGAQGTEQGTREESRSGAGGRADGTGAQGGAQGSGGEDQPTGAVSDSGTEVPEVSGRNVEQAKGALKEAGLIVGGTRPVASRDQPEGSVAGTEPSAGSFVEAQTPITLLVSGGPDGPAESSGSAGASASSPASASPASTSPASSAGASSASASASPGASRQSR